MLKAFFLSLETQPAGTFSNSLFLLFFDLLTGEPGLCLQGAFPLPGYRTGLLYAEDLMGCVVWS